MAFKSNINLPFLFLWISVLLATGCQSLPFIGKDENEKEIPPGIVSLHQIIPEGVPGGTLALPLAHPESSRVLQVHKIPLISSSRFQDVTFAEGETEETQTMIARLDRRGRMRWMQACAEMGGRFVAVVVDGEYQFMWRVPRPGRTKLDTVRIHGPWDLEISEVVAKRAAANYRKLNNK